MQFGTAIRDARIAKKLSQGQVARHLKVSQPSVSAWESGDAFPAVPMLTPLAQLLDLNLEEVLALAAAGREQLGATA